MWRSIRARLTLWYALSSTAAVAVLFVVGYGLLEDRLRRSLDVINATQFEEIKVALGPDYRTVGLQVVQEFLRETTAQSSFDQFLQVQTADGRVVFASANLHGRTIPMGRDEPVFEIDAGQAGPLRVGVFSLEPYRIAMASSLTPLQEEMANYVRIASALGVAMLFVSGAIGFFFSEMMLRPVRAIGATAQRISSSNLSERVAVSSVKDELSDLARVLNDMFDRLEASFEQIRVFAAEASHELKTPLSLVRLHAETLLGDAALPAAAKEAVVVQLEELGRLNQIIDELLLLSRADARAMTLTLEAQDPSAFLQAFVQDAQVLAEHHGHRFEASHTGHGPVAFEAKWMRQVLLNLLMNALHASAPDGRILLQSQADAAGWRIAVENDGPRLSEAERQHIFERFRRVKQPRGDYQGTGLGLAICRSIVALHGGRIRAVPAEACNGLRVEIDIPPRG